MSDNGSISSNLADLGRETVKQIVKAPISIAKGATDQVLDTNSEEKKAKEKAEQIRTFNRIKEIEAEMAQIRRENEQKRGPEVKTSQEQSTQNTQDTQKKKIDEASRQAVGRAEQGRNFKG